MPKRFTTLKANYVNVPPETYPCVGTPAPIHRIRFKMVIVVNANQISDLKPVNFQFRNVTHRRGACSTQLPLFTHHFRIPPLRPDLTPVETKCCASSRNHSDDKRFSAKNGPATMF
jgi:hypothetical protein